MKFNFRNIFEKRKKNVTWNIFNVSREIEDFKEMFNEI